VRVGGDVVALDLASGPEITLAALTPDRYEVTSVSADDGAAVHWEQHRGGVGISRIDRSPTGLAGVYRIGLREAAQAIRLFDDRPPPATALQPLLDSAAPGAVVQLGEGRFQGPATVPDGITVRGMGWEKTTILGDEQTAVHLGNGSRLEHVHLTEAPERYWIFPAPSVVLRGAGAAVVGCRCDGHVVVTGDDASVLSVVGIGVIGSAERLTVERCALKGMRWDVGIEITGGAGHRITRNEIVEHLCAVRLTGASASIVAENRLEGRWWGVHLSRCDHVEVRENSIRQSMRAIDVEAGNGSAVSGNRIADGDSGALIESGATDVTVIDNHIERCRIGIVVWDAPTTRLGPNTFVDLHEEDPVVHGPDVDPG
jgi:alpha-L-fucosidase